MPTPPSDNTPPTTPLPLDPTQIAHHLNQATGNPSSGPFHEYIPTLAQYLAKHYK